MVRMRWTIARKLGAGFGAMAAVLALMVAVVIYGLARVAAVQTELLEIHEPTDRALTRAKIIKQLAYQVFEVTGRNPIIDVAIELEKIALEDEYFRSRKLYPNVDFYSGIIYEAMGFPLEMFPVLFAIARTSGWVAQWAEMLTDEEQRIARPRQIYLGAEERPYVPLDQRAEAGPLETELRGPL